MRFRRQVFMDFGLLYESDKGEYEVLNDVRMADIHLASLVYLLVYISTYCVPIALLHQNEPSTPWHKVLKKKCVSPKG